MLVTNFVCGFKRISVFRSLYLPCSNFKVICKEFCTTKVMAKSKYEYVKSFELEDKCVPNCWIVVTLDGKYFQRFSEVHGYEKPNDKRALELMSRAAATVMDEMRDICVAYGQSDEYSFVFRKDSNAFNRRSEKILTVVNSIFSSAFVYYWKSFFGFTNMLYPPAFEGHIFLFPSELNLKDYLSWRQTELHANNLYSSAFWSMVLKGKLTPKEVGFNVYVI